MEELKRDYTIVIVTHNMQQAARVSDMTAFMSVMDHEDGTKHGGLVEFGRALFAYSTIASAAREGVRYATVHGSESKHPATADDISAYVRTKAVGLHNVVVAVMWLPTNAPGSTVRVQVRYTFTTLLPRLLAFKTIPMSSTSFMVIVH